MDYIFKEVQIYIKLLLISSKAETNYINMYVLISTERVKVTVQNQIHNVGILNFRKKCFNLVPKMCNVIYCLLFTNLNFNVRVLHSSFQHRLCLCLFDFSMLFWNFSFLGVFFPSYILFVQ